MTESSQDTSGSMHTSPGVHALAFAKKRPQFVLTVVYRCAVIGLLAAIAVSVSDLRGGVYVRSGSVSVSDMPSIRVSDLPSVSVSDLPSVRVSDLPRIRVSDLPSVSVSDMPSVRVSDLPFIRVDSLPEPIRVFAR
jgi:hypothetical protein